MSSRTVHVGDKVRFFFGTKPVIGEVLEDRGPIGVGARHLYLITYERGKGNSYLIELPLEKIEVLEPNKEPA
jgi:hypothetical protein